MFPPLTITSSVDETMRSDIDPTSIHPGLKRRANQIEASRPSEKPTQNVAVTPVAVFGTSVADLLDVRVDPVGEADLQGHVDEEEQGDHGQLTTPDRTTTRVPSIGRWTARVFIGGGVVSSWTAA